MFKAIVIAGSSSSCDFMDSGMFIGDTNHLDDAFGVGTGDIIMSQDSEYVRDMLRIPFKGMTISIFDFTTDNDRERFYQYFGVVAGYSPKPVFEVSI